MAYGIIRGFKETVTYLTSFLSRAPWIDQSNGRLRVSVETAATNASTNIAQIGGTTTVTGGVSGIIAVGGNIAHGTASTANPVPTGGRIIPTTIATIDTGLVAGDTSWIPITSGYQKVMKPFGTAELDFCFPWTSVSTTTTLQTLIPASGTASIRNYITGVDLDNDALGGAGSFWIVDGGFASASVTIATPGVFTATAHPFVVGQPVMWTALGTITGISTNTMYWVTSTSFAANTFTIAATPGGTALQITGSTSATTVYGVMQQFRLQTTAGTRSYTFHTPLRGLGNLATNAIFPVSLTSGSVFANIHGYRGF